MSQDCANSPYCDVFFYEPPRGGLLRPGVSCTVDSGSRHDGLIARGTHLEETSGMRKVLFAGLLVALAAVAPLSAQNPSDGMASMTGSWVVSLGGGATIPVGDASDIFTIMVRIIRYKTWTANA